MILPIEFMRNIRRIMKLMEISSEFRGFHVFDPDKPYLIPRAEVGVTPKIVVYNDDGVNLYRYNPITEKQYETPLVIVYALINKPYILDLTPERSVVRRFLQAGFDVYLIDWGEADLVQQFSLDEYVDGFLYDFIEEVKAQTNSDKVNILGYCMGGGMAAMYSALYPENVRNLILLAATLYFDKKEVGGMVKLSDKRFFDPKEIIDVYGYVPAWFLAERFKYLRPVENYITKYINMFLNAENKKLLEDFMRMEKWIHDGVNVAPMAYYRYVKEMYQNNALTNGRLFINGRRVDPKRITMPVAAVVGEKDHLAPPPNTIRFLDYIGSKDKKIFRTPGGHVGTAISRKALAVWDEVAKWLGERSGKLIPTRDWMTCGLRYGPICPVDF